MNSESFSDLHSATYSFNWHCCSLELWSRRCRWVRRQWRWRWFFCSCFIALFVVRKKFLNPFTPRWEVRFSGLANDWWRGLGLQPRGCFLKVPVTQWACKAVQFSFKRFENSSIKLKVKERKWTSYSARTCFSNLWNLISKYDFRPIELLGPLARSLCHVIRQWDFYCVSLHSEV